MNNKGVSTLKVAATYIGTVVGAGFATGQEVLQFFTNFGIWGLVGLVFAAAMFVFFGYIIMNLGNQLQARSHQEIIFFSGGEIIGAMIDCIIIFFLFGAVTTMIAGTGALFSQQYHLPSLLGNFIMGALTAFTVLKGIKGVINAISYVVPFLIISVVGISIYTVFTSPPDLNLITHSQNQNGLITNWFLSAVLYVSYNTILSVAVLAPLGNNIGNNKTIKAGAVLGGLGLGIGALMIFLALASNYTQIFTLEVPMIYIAGGISPFIQIIYAVILLAEVYTTAVSSLFGFATRITNVEKKSAKTKFIVFGSTFAAILASQFGFANLVSYLYPIEGYAGLTLLLILVYSRVKRIQIQGTP